MGKTHLASTTCLCGEIHLNPARCIQSRIAISDQLNPLSALFQALKLAQAESADED